MRASKRHPRGLWASVFLAVLCHAAATASAEELDDLAWLCGAWGQDKTIIESWLAPQNGLMLGVNRTPGAPGSRPFFEFLRIEARPEGTFYVASPLGRAATEFELVEIGDRHVVFENPEHDFPQRIAYRLDGDDLTAEISAGEGDDKKSRVFRWHRVPCECRLSHTTESAEEGANEQ